MPILESEYAMVDLRRVESRPLGAHEQPEVPVLGADRAAARRRQAAPPAVAGSPAGRRVAAVPPHPVDRDTLRSFRREPHPLI